MVLVKKGLARGWSIPLLKSLRFVSVVFSIPDQTHQSSLEQKSGFSQWKAPERICVKENTKNHTVEINGKKMS